MSKVKERYEEVPEEELTAEELFEQRKAEIDAMFEERSFFQRMGDMFSGLSKPRSSREYKIARIELQRLIAPLIAILLPVVSVIALIVITAVTESDHEIVTLDIAKVQEEDTPLEEEEEPEPEPPPETPPDEMVDVVVDTPVVGPVSDFPVSAVTPVTSGPVSVKPATQDSVAFIKSPIKMGGISGSRNPGMIGRMTRGGAGYGDANTEAAVLKALRWLKVTQKPSGNWDGLISNTGLAILAYLAHGERPGASEEFGSTVANAIQYLINAQYEDKDGTVKFKGSDGNEYAFLIATYALCESYGMSPNPNVKEAALKALERIVKNQGPTGGYDYKINKESTRDDMSFAGWAFQALKAGKMAGLHPDGLEECIKKAIKYMKTRAFRNGGFGYCAGNNPSGLTATGCLAMQLLGYGDSKEVTESLESMRAWLPTFESKEGFRPGGPTPGGNPQYYCYYASQCKYQAGMREGALPNDVKSWQEWNVAMKKLYPSTIITEEGKYEFPEGKPRLIGHWTNKDGSTGGVPMATALCALQLMVYYRYLPTTQTKAGAIEGAGTNDAGKKVKRSKAAEKAAADVEVEVDI